MRWWSIGGAGWWSACSGSAGRKSSGNCTRLLQRRSAFPSLQFVTDPTRPSSPVPIPVIIDTDPGIDDMLALLLALASPELDVRRVSVSYRNTLVAMIGNVAAQGNTTRYAEFNAWCDPEALDIVLRAELPTEMVGLDVTRQLVLAPNEVTRLAHSGAAQAVWIQDALRFYMEFHKRQEGLDGCILNDVLAIAALVHPPALTFEEQRLTVHLDDAEHRGHTRADPDGARVKVATRVELGPVRRLLSERVFRWAARAAATPIASEEVQG